MEATPKLRQAIQNYKNGDAVAFTTLYEESHKYIYVCVYNVMHGNDNAQDMINDIMQDTYVEISRYLHQLEDEEKFMSWAGTIATRKCHAYFKKNKKYVLLGEEDTTFEQLSDSEDIIPETVMIDSKYRLETLYVEHELDDVGTNTTSPFAMVMKSEILQCTYESKEVADGLSALIDRTQQLKVSYSLEEAMDILRDLSELVPEITKQDHARNYELRTHKYNNKFGPTYRRKWDPVYWVEQVVIGQIHKHSIDQEAEIREIYELLFQMGIQEKRNEMNGVSGSMDTIHLMDNIFRKKYSEELADFSEFAWIMSWKYSDTVSEGEVTLEELYRESLQE